jgi:hypothetical protein
MAAEKVVLLAQDTTPLSYNTLPQTQGLGCIAMDYTRGLFLHSLQAFRLDGLAARGSLVLAESLPGPTTKRRRASLAAAVPKATDNLETHGDWRLAILCLSSSHFRGFQWTGAAE